VDQGEHRRLILAFSFEKTLRRLKMLDRLSMHLRHEGFARLGVSSEAEGGWALAII